MFDDLKPQSPQADNSGKGDEQKNKQAGGGGLSAPTAPKQQVEDMFAETDSAPAPPSGATPQQAESPVKPSVFQPKPLVPPRENLGADTGGENADSASPAEPKQAGDIKKYIMIGIIVLAVIVVLSGGWYAYSKFFTADADLIPADDLSEEPVIESNKIIEQENNIDEIKEQKQAVEPVVKPADKDRDGLSDEDEAQLGTNANSVDSDGDGLFDREEVKVYKTDPLNPDTDGDGYSDGEEVKKGYNPNGAGKLYEIK